MKKRARVGILTNFTGADQAFSLVVVVKTQAKMFLDAGYHPVLFVAKEFEDDNAFPGIEIRKSARYEASVDEIADTLRSMTEDIEVMLCHDLVFLSNYAAWGSAVRLLAKELDHIAWIHWQHSRGDHVVEEPCEHSWYAYPNNGDLEHVAKVNGTTVDRVRYIPHPLDFNYLGWSSLAIRIAEDTGFPFADVSCVLPTRMDRQKQIDKAIRLIAGIKKQARASVLS